MMQAFKKWDKEYREEERISTQIGRRVGWRAALEWLLTQHPCGYMRDIMEKELEDKAEEEKLISYHGEVPE